MALLLKMKKRLLENSCENLIWLIDILPKLAGFSVSDDNVKVLFWIIHISLSVYVYIVGTIVYQIYYVENMLDAVNSFFNVPIVVMILSDTMWFVLKRNKIKYLIKLSFQNDALILEIGKFVDKYLLMLRNIKIIILTCYMFHLVNDVFIFIPSRISDMKSFSIANCVGLEPLTTTPNQEICMFILASQEITSIFVVGGYDAIILFLFSHITAVVQILCEDMENFSDITKNVHQTELNLITDRIRNIVKRHSLVIETVRGLQDLFALAIGMGFFLNAISLCLFFVLPTEVCLNFGPLIYYYLSVFFLYCYLGQRLTNSSEKFERAVYCCGWQYLDVKVQKSVLLMLRQAQKPLMLHAAKIIPICMFTFAGTMQNIYKFVTVFKIKNTCISKIK